MPSNGPHSFLLNAAVEAAKKRNRCQCPPTGHTHFYRTKKGEKEGPNMMVSIPSNGPHSFLQEETCRLQQTGGVSMPSNGPHSFLQMAKVNKWPERTSVNALQRATLISTETKYGYSWVSIYVSMPSNGPHSFLRHIEAKTNASFDVSMPSNGPHSFLLNLFKKKKICIFVSMPSNGPHSFLPNRPGSNKLWERHVSMPSNGPHSFLPRA